MLGDFSEFHVLRSLVRGRVVSSVEEAEEFLNSFLGHLKEFARFIVAYICSIVLQDKQVLTNQSFVSGIRLLNMKFDPVEIRAKLRFSCRLRRKVSMVSRSGGNG